MTLLSMRWADLGVERVDVLVGLGGKGGDLQSLKLHDLVVTLRLGRVEATA